jgi:nucleotide sugar dehydrogenase
MKIAVVGFGPVGVAVAGSAVMEGHEVDIIDLSQDAFNRALNFMTPEERKVFEDNGGKVTIGVDYKLRWKKMDAVLVCVDTKNVQEASFMLKLELEKVKLKKDFVITLESTVTPDIGRWFASVFEKFGHVAVSPERIMEGRLIRNFREQPKIVGADDSRPQLAAMNLYTKLGMKAAKHSASIEEACMAKLSENTFRYWNIRLAQIISDLCAKYDHSFSSISRCRFDRVRELVNMLDDRMLHDSSIGIGGTCLEQNFTLMCLMAKKETKVMKNVLQDAHYRKQRVADFLLESLNSKPKHLSKTNVVFLGVTYRPNGFGLRASPALEIIDMVQSELGDIYYYDPLAVEHDDSCPLILKEGIEDLLDKVDAAVLMVPHDELKNEMTIITEHAKRTHGFMLVNLTNMDLPTNINVDYHYRRF